MSEIAVAAPRLSAGALLRQAREAAGLHIGALSVSLKIPVKKIEALEADRVDQLPDTVFARALASSICRTLKVDPAPILAALPQGNRTVLKADDGQLNASFQPTGGAPLNSVRELVSKPFVIVGLALVAGALLLLFLPERNLPSAVQEAGVLAPNAPVGVPAAPQKDIVPNHQALPDAAAPSLAGTSKATSTEKGAAPLPLAATAAVAPQNPTVSNPAAIKPSLEGVVAFEARGPSWVEVTDSAGAVQLRKTLAAGESIAATGQAPLKIIIGRADAVSVKVRGQDFSLAAVSRDNVARFEVK